MLFDPDFTFGRMFQLPDRRDLLQFIDRPLAGPKRLGTMLGKLLAESGGAEVLAKGFNRFFGPQRVGWCIVALAVAMAAIYAQVVRRHRSRRR